MVSAGAGEIRVRDLSVAFDTRGSHQTVLDHLNFDIRPGEFFVLVGQSGCGKTTFLRTLQGLQKPSTGKISVSDKTIEGPGPDRGFVFQQDALYPWRTIEANVAFGLELQGKPKAFAKARSAEMLNLVGLKGVETRFPHELSGGMRQRVNLARAIAIDPEILLMDEPFAALDALTRETMQGELLRISEATKKTVVFITHQIDEAVLLADRVAVMAPSPGRIVEIIDIDVPRPRTAEFRRSPEFQAFVNRISKHIGSSEH
jgi:NitT/TauT family transport system ATP-binding protein